MDEERIERLQKVATVAFFLHIPFLSFEASKHGLGMGESRYIVIELTWSSHRFDDSRDDRMEYELQSSQGVKYV